MGVLQAEVLAASDWRVRAAAHAERVDADVAPHLERRRAGVKHPVFDFLFTYYSHRPAQLRRWHPGFGVALEDAEEYADLKGYETVSRLAGARTSTNADARWSRCEGRPGLSLSITADARWLRCEGRPGLSLETTATVSAEYVASQRPLLQSLHRLLDATARRTPHLGCFGLHEWAMVHRLGEDETRHADWPLRLGPRGTDEVVESHRIACSHFDAFRFFTESARPLNTLSPGREDRAEFEQPGCLHAGMDLYKHAFRLSPMICSDLVADCFELARDIRVMDMRAAPYDLADLGFDPIRIETAEGKREYTDLQRHFADRAAPLRQRLLKECERLLDAT